MKPLGKKAYGSIPHLPSSRLGEGDHHCHEGQAKICLKKTRDKHDLIIVTEKLDGSCCSMAKIDDEIIALTRSGWKASTSKYEQHQLFDHWVRQNQNQFQNRLNNGQRFVGEWVAQAHGTRYELPHGPFVIFDLIEGDNRKTYKEMLNASDGMPTAGLLYAGPNPYPLEAAKTAIKTSLHGAIDPVEGAVWRVERKGKFDFIAKWVRPDKIDGYLLPEISGKEAVWNWKP